MTWSSRIFPLRGPSIEEHSAAVQPPKERRAVVFSEERPASARPLFSYQPGTRQPDVPQAECLQPAHDAPLPEVRQQREVSPQAQLLAPALFDAVKRGDITAVQHLLEEGADPWLQDTTPGALSASVLHYAVLRGGVHLSDHPQFPDSTAHALVDLLLSAGAPVNAEDQMGCTALHCAAALGMDEVVAELLSRGAFMDIQDKQIKYTPMHAAAAAGRVGCLILMIEAGAMVDEEVARAINRRLRLEEAKQSVVGPSEPSWAIGTAPDVKEGGHRSLALVHSTSNPQVHRSDVSVLQKGRNEAVLPNGGGRLWALKDVTGMGIWDVLDSPATACGVLDVLLQDLAHIDLMGARSLVQLIQQTQSLRHIISVAQKAVAAEAEAAGLPAEQIAPLMDAVKNHLTRVQASSHHQAMRQPQRERMPLPVMRPALLSTPAERKEHGKGRRGSVLMGPHGSEKPLRGGLGAGSPSPSRKARLIKAGSAILRSGRHFLQARFSNSEANSDEPNPHGSPSLSRTRLQNSSLHSQASDGSGLGPHGHQTALPSRPSMGMPRSREGSGVFKTLVQRLSSGFFGTPDGGQSDQGAPPSPFQLTTHTPLGHSPLLPPLSEHCGVSEHASGMIHGRHLQPVTSESQDGGPSGPVGEQAESDQGSMEDTSDSGEETDMSGVSEGDEEGYAIRQHSQQAVRGQPCLLPVWDPGTRGRGVPPGQPGPVAEAAEDSPETGSRSAMASAAAAARALPAPSSQEPHASVPQEPTAAWATPAAAPTLSSSGDMLPTGGHTEAPPKQLQRNATMWTPLKARLGSRGAVGQSHQELKPTKPAPPGFKVWTLSLEQKLDECIRCIQWQTLKMEQYVEALIKLAKEAPIIHSVGGDEEILARTARRNKKGKGNKGVIVATASNLRAAAQQAQIAEDGSDDAGIDLVWELIRMSIAVGDRTLAHLMVDRMVSMFDRALLRCPWSTVMVDMCQVYPEVFHHLLNCLKDVSDEVCSAFVTSFNLEDLERKIEALRAPSGNNRQSVRVLSSNKDPATTDTTVGLPSSQLHGKAHSSAPGPHHELGLAAARMASVSHPLSGMRIPEKRGQSFSAFANRMGHLKEKGYGQLDRYSSANEDAASFKYTLYRHLVAGLTGVDYTLMKCFVEKLDRGVLQEMAQKSVYKDFVALLPSKLVTRQGGGPDVLLEELAGETDKAPGQEDKQKEDGAGGERGAGGSGSLAGSGALSVGSSAALTRSGGVSVGSGSGAVARARMVRRHLRGSLAKSTLGGGGPAINETKAEVLNVENLLSAALAARSAESVQAGVESLVAWVEMNARNKRLCFIDGLSTQLVSEMAAHFPSAAGALFNISPQASRDIKVSSWLLGKTPIVYQCSNTRYSFMWRQAELQDLDNLGYELWQVEQLADQNMRFTYICKAAQQGCSVDDILELMDLGLLGQNIADLVSSGARLEDVKDMLERGMSAELLGSMLAKKLSWQLVEVLLNHHVTRTTVEDRTMRMDLLQFDAESATNRGHNTFSHAFVTRFLEKWAAASWDKTFLDKVFHSSDSLCTKLKTAYDYKLSMRSNYLNTKATTPKKTSVLDWPRLMCILSAFMKPIWVPSRWLTALAFLLVLLVIELCGSLMGVMAPVIVHDQTVDGVAKVLPIINAATLGEKSLLAGLMNADVPSAWYGTPVARAIIAVQWRGFAQVLMAMHLLEHMILMGIYGFFLLLVHTLLTKQQEDLFFDGTSRGDLVAVNNANKQYQLEQVNAASSNQDWSIMDNYAYGDLFVNRQDMLFTVPGAICITLLAVYALCNLATRALQIRRAGWRLWSSNLANHLDVMCAFFVLCTIVDFLIEDVFSHVLALGAMGGLVLFVRLTLFSSIVERMGSLVRVVTEIMKDLRYFFILIAIIFGGFAIAFAVQLGGENNYTTIALQLFSTMTGDFTASMLQGVLETPGHWLMPKLALALWIVYGFMVGIVFVALLISIMNDTYDRIKDAEETEVLRNKARIIVDLQTLLPVAALQALQDASLGPFLHTLMPNAGDSQVPTLAKMDEWQGRMYQIRNAVRMELLQHLGPKANKDASNSLIVKEDIHKELMDLTSALKTIKTEMAHLSKTVVALQTANAQTMAAMTAAGLERPGTAVAARGASSSGAAKSGANPTVEELANSASSILGNVNMSGAGPSSGASSAHAGGSHAPSPAVAAALEGRTMLNMGGLQGRYFSREIPSVQGTASAKRQIVWKVAAKMAQESTRTELNPDGTSSGASRPSTPAAAGSPGSAAVRALTGDQTAVGGIGSLPSARMGQGASNVSQAAQPPASTSGLLTRFAVLTMANLGTGSPAARQRRSGSGGEAGSGSAEPALLPGQAPAEALQGAGSVVSSPGHPISAPGDRDSRGPSLPADSPEGGGARPPVSQSKPP